VGKVAQTIYTHISQCKNNNIKGERKKDRSRKINRGGEYSQGTLHESLEIP
jgi:hypothetical protein